MRVFEKYRLDKTLGNIRGRRVDLAKSKLGI